MNQAQLDFTTMSVPYSRATNPKSAIEAGDDIAISGKAKARRELVARYVVQYPGRTCRELTAILNSFGHDEFDYHETMRRLSGSDQTQVRKGVEKVCSIKPHKPVTTWWPA